MFHSIEIGIIIGVIIHLLIFFGITWKSIFNKKFRDDVIGLPLYVILLLGFFWPVTIILILLIVIWIGSGFKKM